MPALSPTMEEGSISSWSVKEGDQITAGDVICEIETDKATVDFEMVEDGFLAKIFVSGTDTTKVGDVIAILVEDADDIAAFQNASPSEFGESAPVSTENSHNETVITDEKRTSQPDPQTQRTPVTQTIASSGGGERVFISPLAKKTAQKEGIEIYDLSGRGTGPNGRVIYQDVLDFLEVKAQQPVSQEATQQPEAYATAGSNFVDVPMTSEALKQNLAQSKKEIPHYYLNVEVDLTEIMALRQIFLEVNGVEISVNDFIVKASAASMKTIPALNASFRGTFIRQFSNCHINLFTQSSLGLIENVSAKGLSEVAEESLALDSSLDPSKIRLGTFSVVNLGMYGIKAAMPIVVHGQSGCVGVGAVEEEIVPATDENGEISFKSKPVVNISLSCDHRVVDGAVGAQWLQHFKKLMEDPQSLLL